MRVIVPFTQLHPTADRALRLHAPAAERVDVSASDEAYFDLLAQLWKDGEGFCLVEHDIAIHATVVPELASCSQPWCVFPYARRQRGPHSTWDGEQWTVEFPLLTASLGCTRFSSSLIRHEPDLMDVVSRLSVGPFPRHWARLDDFVAQALFKRGYASGPSPWAANSPAPCVHHPEVTHHTWVSDGCLYGNPLCPR